MNGPITVEISPGRLDIELNQTGDKMPIYTSDVSMKIHPDNGNHYMMVYTAVLEVCFSVCRELKFNGGEITPDIQAALDAVDVGTLIRTGESNLNAIVVNMAQRKDVQRKLVVEGKVNTPILDDVIEYARSEFKFLEGDDVSKLVRKAIAVDYAADIIDELTNEELGEIIESGRNMFEEISMRTAIDIEARLAQVKMKEGDFEDEIDLVLYTHLRRVRIQ